MHTHTHTNTAEADKSRGKEKHRGRQAETGEDRQTDREVGKRQGRQTQEDPHTQKSPL